jgi:hypothetical protein
MGAGTQPWPQVPVGNKNHTSAAVVIIGAGISGIFPLRSVLLLISKLSYNTY